VSRTSDQAICLRHWDWSETSQTLALFTREHGLLRALAKGSKRPATPYSGGVELLTRATATLILKPTTDLHLLVEWDLTETFPPLRQNLRCFYAAAYAAECVQRMVHDHDPHPELFDALLVLLRALDGPASIPPALLRFQHQLLVWTGFKPDLASPDQPPSSQTSPTPPPAQQRAPSIRHFAPELGGLVALPPAPTPAPTPNAAAQHRPPAGLWPVRDATLRVIHAVASPDALAPIPQDATQRDLERANHFLASYIAHLLGATPNSLRSLFPRLVVPGERTHLRA
jgi:DNA repair protein RecO (recombination protein O)